MAKKLTARSIEQAKPRKNKHGQLIRTEIPDGGKPGLYLVIQPSGKKSWAVRYRLRGRPRKVMLEGFPSLATAHKLAQVELDKAAEGRDPAAEKQDAKRARAREALTKDDLFGNVARLFIQRYAKPKTRSWIETARLLGLRPDPDKPEELIAIRGGIVDKWCQRRAQDIRKRDVLDVLDGIVDRGAGIVANRTLAAVRKLFNWAVERDILESSPCMGVTAPAAAVERERILSDEEIRWFWHATDREGFPFGTAAQLLLLSGQRLNEVTGMRRVELASGIWTIPDGRTKNKKTHTVPLSEAAAAILAGLPHVKESCRICFHGDGEGAGQWLGGGQTAHRARHARSGKGHSDPALGLA